MIIDKPQYLRLLLLVIPVCGNAIYGFSFGKNSLRKLGGEWRFEALTNVFVVKNFFIHTFYILFIICAVLALADIRWDDQLVEDNRDGYEFVIMLDISRSMLADDVRPNRLNATIAAINRLIKDIPDAKYGIVVFKGKAAKVFPVNDDLYALSLFLNTVQPEMLTVPGSNIEEGIKTSLKVFTTAGKYRAIFLFTDGESKTGNSLAAAKIAGDAGVPIISVLVGTEKGQNVPLGPGDYLRDKNGKLVLSRANTLLLKDIAKQSHGQFYELNGFSKVKNELLSIVKHFEHDDIDKGLKLEKKEKWDFFLSFAILFLILALLTRGIRWQKII